MPYGKPPAAETLPVRVIIVVRMAATLLVVAIEPALGLRQGVGRLVPELVPTPECRYYYGVRGEANFRWRTAV